MNTFFENLIPSGSNGVGYRLMKTRIFRNLSREELAVKSGVAYFTICKIEEGKIARPKCCPQLAAALDVTPGFLQFGDPLPESCDPLSDDLAAQIRHLIGNAENRRLIECLVNCLMNKPDGKTKK